MSISFRSTRILKNTVFLYIRMLITMAAALYASRLLLQTLGADNFGLYHVIAGFVVLAGFLQGALSGTTQRFIAFELGKEASSDLQNIFSMSVNIHILFAIGIMVIGGSVGSYFLPNILSFEDSRTTAVLVVFWFSLFSFMVNIAIVPFHAIIIAHEEMKVFAWISIADSLLKLMVVLLIPYMPYDPLIAYGILIFVVTLLICLFYVLYVYTKYHQIRYTKSWDNTLFKRLLSFSGWTIWGNAAGVFANQGTHILLNVYFGPALNAAKTIGDQASGALNQFVSNLQLAVNPQIIKSYSSNDKVYTDKLINYGSKYNFFLIIMLATPILIRTEDFLNLWLVEPPIYATLFLRLILINVILSSVTRPLITAAAATGNIKLYQCIVGGVLLLNLPASYLALDAGLPPSSVFIVAIVLTLVSSVARVVMLKRIFDFCFFDFVRVALLRIIVVWICSLILSYSINVYIPRYTNLLYLFIFSIYSVVATAGSIWILGLEKYERNTILKFLKR